jgi:FkbM family methyltransferase
MNTVVKMIGKAYFRALGYYPTSIHGFKFKLDPYHVGFWRGLAKGRWEPHTYRIMSRFINAGTVYCDLGAWIGPTVIYAARKCKQVVCFEPDPVAYRFLCWNVEMNELKNVMSFNIALADRNGMQRMSSFGANLGDSMTSLLANGQETNGVDVLTLTWETFTDITKIDKIDFLKIDIEGGEFALLPTLKEYLSLHRPIVYLSTHPQFLDVRLREKKMHQIIDVMGMYKKCLNEDIKPVDIDELNSENAMNSDHSYLFMD